MAASSNTARQRGRAHAWFARNNQRLLAISIVSIMFLFFIYLFTSTFQIPNPAVAATINAITIALVFLVAMSIVWKGMVPAVICALGITLLHASIVLPYYSAGSVGEEQNFKRYTIIISQQSVLMAGNMHFAMGMAAIVLSMIVAYRPSLLFARNRPPPLDSIWEKYPVWNDNVLLADGRKEQSVPVKSLMTDQDRYLMWRYEYVLASVYGTPHLVKPEGMVPKGSSVFRDRESGKVVGKARYNGYFM